MKRAIYFIFLAVIMSLPALWTQQAAAAAQLDRGESLLQDHSNIDTGLDRELNRPISSFGILLFVDRSDPNCSDSGPGNQSIPFCSINAAASNAFFGTMVTVASGTYYEQVDIVNSGREGAPVVFTAAAGADVKVVGQKHGFNVASQHWISIKGFTVSDTFGYGVSITDSSHIALINNRVTRAGQPVKDMARKGIYLSGSTDSLLFANTVDHNSDSGIYLTRGTRGIQIIGNTVSYNARGYSRAAAGIDVRSGGNFIKGNISHHNEDTGIQIRLGASGNFVVGNLCSQNGDHGIYVQGAPGQHIIGNSIYRNGSFGVDIERSSLSCVLANNIIVDDGKGAVRIAPKSLPGTSMDFDQFYQSNSAPLVVWGMDKYYSLFNFVADTGMEMNGLEEDPLWIAPEQGDFHLASGSPAIDSADSAVVGEMPTDLEDQIRVDIVEIPDSGRGSRTYDDRGAYEYRSGDVEGTGESGT